MNIFARAIKYVQDLDAALTECKTQEFRRSTPTPAPKSNPNYTPPPSVLPSNMVIYCYLKRGTTENYKEYNPTLQLNELAVEYDNNEIIGYKLGDGVTKWSELEYVTSLTDVKEFWLYVDDINNGRRLMSKIILNPFTINNYLGGTKPCLER